MNEVGMITAGALQRMPLPSVVGDSSITPANRSTVGAEFESVFMSMLLKSMRETTGEEGLFGGDSSDTYGGLFDLYMGRHMSLASPLGIGSIIEGQLVAANDNAEAPAESPAETIDLRMANEPGRPTEAR